MTYSAYNHKEKFSKMSAVMYREITGPCKQKERKIRPTTEQQEEEINLFMRRGTHDSVEVESIEQ